jgi:hypothetical protein
LTLELTCIQPFRQDTMMLKPLLEHHEPLVAHKCSSLQLPVVRHVQRAERAGKTSTKVAFNALDHRLAGPVG